MIYWACSWALVFDCKKLLVMHYRLTENESAGSLHRLLGEYCGPNAGWGEWSVYWMITRISQCLLAGGALMAPLCWEALQRRNTISRIPTTQVAAGLCQTAAERRAVISAQGVAAWSDGHGAEIAVTQLLTSSGDETKTHNRVGPCRKQTHSVMCMQVVCVYQIINKHPINVTEYICRFSKLSECLTAVLTKLCYCSSCIEVQGCFVVYIYRMDTTIFSLL